jgi:Fe-S oxidoreductase
MFEDFFMLFAKDFNPGKLEGNAVVHGHCHQKSLCGTDALNRILSRVDGLDYKILDSGCCGMAGAFGYEKDHYEISRAIGERVLLPAVRSAAPGDLIVADGFSCRHQIADFCDGRQAIHVAELLAKCS